MASPITKVYPVGGSSTSFSLVPTKFVYHLEDISASDAGRTEDGKMHKMRIGQISSIDLEWANVSTSNVATILQAFNPEYITVEYLDPYTGATALDNFYVGNRSAPLYNSSLDIWENVGFTIIKRSAE